MTANKDQLKNQIDCKEHVSENKKGKSNKIVIIIIVVLSLIVCIAASINLLSAGSRMSLAANAEIQVKSDGNLLFTVTPDILTQLGIIDFKASLNADGKEPVQHTYSGIPLKDIIELSNIKLENIDQVNVVAVDGYTVALPVNEIKADNNIYLVIKDNGEYLGTIKDKNGRGPYMIVIRKDPFSQRWVKYVCEIDIK